MDVLGASAGRAVGPRSTARQNGAHRVEGRSPQLATPQLAIWYISGAEAESGYAPASQPGWYFRAVNPDPAWISNDPVGPYRSFKDALDDLIQGELASGGY
jgi:hypothetical protein